MKERTKKVKIIHNLDFLIYKNKKISLSIVCSIALYLCIWDYAFGCDFTAPDKIKHIEVCKQASFVTKKIFQYPLMVTRPLKYITGGKFYLIFPENYVPHIISATTIFTVGALKEFPYDIIVPGHTCSFCDLQADCIGIKEGLIQK